MKQIKILSIILLSFLLFSCASLHNQNSAMQNTGAVELDGDSNQAIDITLGGTNAKTAAQARVNLDAQQADTDLDIISSGTDAQKRALISAQAKPVDNISDLLNETPDFEGDVRYVKGYSSDNDGGQGVFVASFSDLSASVTADTLHGKYAPFASDPTGASGAWVRSDKPTPACFGADTSGTVDSTAALQAYITYCGSFFDPAADPRRSPLEIDFGYGHFIISAPLSFDFGTGELGGAQIYGATKMQGTIFEGTHTGNIFEFSSAENSEIHHISFYGAGCSAIRQKAAAFAAGNYLVDLSIRNCEFNANLAECIYGNFIYGKIKNNIFGYFGTAGANHRHILDAGIIGGNVSNGNVVEGNRFVSGAGSYPIDITSGNNWVFKDNFFEGNNYSPIALRGVVSAVFDNNWFEGNVVTGTGHIILSEDSGVQQSRLLIFKNNQIGATASTTHFINATTTAGALDILVEENTGDSFPVGFVFTKYDTVDEAGITSWKNNTLQNYTRNDYDSSKYTLDSFSASKSGTTANVTGDGTIYRVPFNIEGTDRLGTYNTGTFEHIAITTGLYNYSATVALIGVSGSNLEAYISIVTTGGTYKKRINPSSFISGGYLPLDININVPMSYLDTAHVEISVSSGTKIVGVVGSTGTIETFFSGYKIVGG